VTETMEALVVFTPNVLEIHQIPLPEPGPNEVLARVRSVSICGTDAHLIRGDYPGFWPPAFPFTPGHEWAGQIVALGKGAERFGWHIGDRVAGTSHNACGACQKCVEGRYNLCENYGKAGLHKQYGHSYQGVDATYAVHNVKCIFRLPDSVSYDEGAVVDPASIGLHVARRGNIQPGDTVVVTGAGAVGLLAADCAMVCGAARVVVVGRGYRLSKAAAMGFETVDAMAGDPVTAIRELTGGLGADVVLECRGAGDPGVGDGGAPSRRSLRDRRHPDRAGVTRRPASRARRARTGGVTGVCGRDAASNAVRRERQGARRRVDHTPLCALRL